ncbi:MAG: hypothetical protein M2R45_05015 [Verrucomicrobia subdivision 3 bacterium]|nr:hypothetical protein [Limisphaerales bacterium]MCS1417658.1 hypothetical protein [Limisphaerales bacterium]
MDVWNKSTRIPFQANFMTDIRLHKDSWTGYLGRTRDHAKKVVYSSKQGHRWTSLPVGR